MIVFLLACFLSRVKFEQLAGVRRALSSSIAVVNDSVIMSPSPSNVDAVTAKIPLYVITSTNRPFLLSRSIFHVSALQECFDLHWIIVHSMDEPRINTQPFFRDVFPWITELYAFHASSVVGHYERNVGIDHVIEKYQEGLLYFLDDDNVVSMDLCNRGLANLSTDKMYYADQYNCGQKRLRTEFYRSLWTNATEVHTQFSLLFNTDTGNWLIPLSVLRREPSIRFVITDYGGDGLFYTALVHSQLKRDKNDNSIERLPLVKFHYNELQCERWQAPWTEVELSESLAQYRSVVTDMKAFSESVPEEHKMSRDEVSFHEYVHILYTLRNHVTAPTAVYVEIGVWKGASSIMMSRHPYLTNVIGIDLFAFEHQREEVDVYVHALKGDGTVDVIKSMSQDAVPALQEILNGRGIDILFIDGDHSVQGVRSDFELYLPLVNPGGFICFDDVMDSTYSDGVRLAIMQLIHEGVINLKDYNVIGVVENGAGAGIVWNDPSVVFDWQIAASNEFILQKVSDSGKNKEAV